jgi:signal transduction histidine kinase/CheY-like chemotaxis protein
MRPGRDAVGTAAAVVLIVCGQWTVMNWQTRALFVEEARHNLQRIAEAAAAVVDVRTHAALDEAGEHGTSEYRRAVAPLEAVRAAVQDVTYVYSARLRGDGAVEFVLDATPQGDTDGDGVEDHSFLGEVYADADPALLACLRMGESTASSEVYEDRWGRFLSGFAPLKDDRGGVVGAVGVDLSAQDMDEHLAELSVQQLIALSPWGVVAVVLGVLVYAARRRERGAAELVAFERMRAEEAAEARSRFLANMTHELRTPLTAILGSVELLGDEGVGKAERGEHERTIARNGTHLLELINSVLDMSKMDSGAVVAERRAVDLAVVVRGVMEQMAGRAQAKGLALWFEAAGPLPGVVETDPVRVRQVLVNLIGNAIKFTDVGSVTVRAEVAHGARRCVRLEVVDTGPGMREEQVAGLFRAFGQVDETASRRHQGTGLGLVIAKKLCEALGGDLTVRSEFGQGTTFAATFETDADAACEGRAGELIAARRFEALVRGEAGSGVAVGSGVAGSAVEGGALAGVRVVLAEDSPDSQRVLRVFLEKAGAQVLVAENGLEAVAEVRGAMASGRGVDLVLMDWQMPILDGLGATREIRAMGWGGPVVALTANTGAEDRARCVEAGCTGFLNKPIGRAALVEACRAEVERARGRRAA